MGGGLASTGGAGGSGGVGGALDGGVDGGVDAGVDGGGSVDAGVDAGPCSGALICETFESWPLGPVTRDSGTPPGWALGLTNSTIEVAHSPDGGRGLKIELTADGEGTLDVPLAPAFPTKGYHLYGRVWLYGETLPSTTEYKRHGFVAVTGKSPGTTDYAHVAMRHDQGRMPYFNYFVNPPFIDCAGGVGPGVPMPIHEWVCYELELDDATSSAKLWFDGGTAPVVEMSMRGHYCGDGNTQRVWAFPVLGSLKVGIFAYDAALLRVWVDEVAVSTARLGCASRR